MKRPPAVAGAFYPRKSSDLSIVVEDYLNEAKDLNLKNIKGVIVPHAGLIYSGSVAAFGFKQFEKLSDKKWKVFLIGPAHHAHVNASVGNFESYGMPFGDIAVDHEICGELLKNPIFEFTPDAHAKEHSLEVQLPFLQKVLKDFKIIPILCGTVDHKSLFKALNDYFKKDDCLFVFSSDLSHFLPYVHAQVVDGSSINTILSMDTESDIDACGEIPIKTAIDLSIENNYKLKLLNHRNSGDVSGDMESVVGYASFAIYK